MLSAINVTDPDGTVANVVSLAIQLLDYTRYLTNYAMDESDNRTVYPLACFFISSSLIEDYWIEIDDLIEMSGMALSPNNLRRGVSEIIKLIGNCYISDISVVTNMLYPQYLRMLPVIDKISEFKNIGEHLNVLSKFVTIYCLLGVNLKYSNIHVAHAIHISVAKYTGHDISKLKQIAEIPSKAWECYSDALNVAKKISTIGNMPKMFEYSKYFSSIIN